MGIKHLWTILTPFCERKPLYELQGKTVAVDLSCWICEAQNIAEYQIQPRMYLRNLYFRTCYLLLMEVNPVFVLEGKAPELKYETIAARNAIQFKGAKPKTDGVKTGKDRSRFHFVLKQCEEMLSCMGLVCVKGKGEAESMCAYLNEGGLVDGCISQDSDCFAYGAKVVYRNFSISTQGAYAASGGAVDIYDITKAYRSLNFGRNKIIAMALLCGSDYNEGVQGIGKESVMKFFDKVSDEETLERLRSWRLKVDLYENYENQLSDKSICTSCGHQGKLQSHTKNGEYVRKGAYCCHSCETVKGCNPFKFKEERLSIKNELNMRNKALQDPKFPYEELINEYLVKKDNVSELDLKWRKPDIVKFVNFASKFLQWEQIYSLEKMLPILTRWQCLNYSSVEKKDDIKGILYPDRIKKTRIPKGVPGYEIIWIDRDGFFKDLVPENQILERNIDLEKLWSTIEPQSLVEKAYPKLVEEFKQSKIKPKLVKRKKKNKTGEDSNKNSSMSEPLSKKTRKAKPVKNVKESKIHVLKKQCTTKTKNEVLDLERSFNDLQISKSIKNIQTLDSFLKKAVLNSQRQANENLETDKLQMCYQTSTPSKSTELQENFDISSFCDNEDDLDLSDIVEEIISRKPDYLEKHLKTIKLNLFENKDECDNGNSSSFFIDSPMENDLFEQTFNMKGDSGESTEEYSFEENFVLDDKKKDDEPEFQHQGSIDFEKDNHIKESLLDSFCDNYVPLLERLKNKI